MARMTRLGADGRTVELAGASAEDAIRRLAAYEDLQDALLAERGSIAAAMDALRAEGKQNTVRFKSLLAQKLQNQSTLARFEVRGL